MHVRAVEIQNLRAVRALEWRLSDDATPGWHIVLGNNGAGKSTFLRSIGLALVGPSNLSGLRQSPKDWLRGGAQAGHVRVEFTRDEAWDTFRTPGAPPSELAALVRVTGGPEPAFVTQDDDPDGSMNRSIARSVWASGARG